jgi:hypothetical protein
MRKLFGASVVLLAVAGGPPGSHEAGTAALASQATPAASTSKPWPAEALDQLLAPIALYPDALLSEMLLCAGNPGKIGALSEWLRSQTAGGTELQEAARAAGFEPSFVSLAVFPDVVNYMARETAWTTKLGQAFTADRSGVFASIQRLRTRARDAGTLKTTAQQEVATKTTSSGQQVIVIEPANPQVIYVPQYNPQVVYTQPTTVVVEKDSSSDAVAAGLIGFTAGIAIGAAMDNDYYYGPYGMHGGFYMYDDAWDDWADHREDQREDWQDHREDLVEDRSERREDVADERGDRAGTTQAQRTQQQQTRQDTRQATATERRGTTQASGQATATQRSTGTTQEARGYSGAKSQATKQRSGTTSDAFSGYSNGRSERAASDRGNKSRSSSRGSGGGGRRR